ncbi:hypothetical protein ACQCRI_19650 [Ralstonia pseudosolanacearum]|uniref:hypothetical protein n=1 Tax=Ralstonia pseudosolanacearum TaxID=1310165 RepID=UPI00143306C4
MASKPLIPLAFGVTAVVVSGIGAWTVYQQFADHLTSQNASTQVERLVAKLAPRAECEPFRIKLLAQAQANPAAGSTQYAIADAWAGAGRVGCVAR